MADTTIVMIDSHRVITDMTITDMTVTHDHDRRDTDRQWTDRQTVDRRRQDRHEVDKAKNRGHIVDGHPHKTPPSSRSGCHIIAFNPINDVGADLHQRALPEMERAPAVLVIIASHQVR